MAVKNVTTSYKDGWVVVKVEGFVGPTKRFKSASAPTAAQCRRFIGKTVKGEILGPLNEHGYTMRWMVEVK